MAKQAPGQVRCEAAKALGRIGTEAALSSLKSAVAGRSDYFDIRISCKAGEEPLMPSVVYCVTAALLENHDLNTLKQLREVLNRWDTHFYLRHLDTVLAQFVEVSHSPEIRGLLKSFLKRNLIAGALRSKGMQSSIPLITSATGCTLSPRPSRIRPGHRNSHK